MNRNSESHFALNPTSLDLPRSQFDLSATTLLSGNVGQLIPFYVNPDILPGDTFNVTTSKVIRFQTMLSPVMGDLVADTYWFFVPHRLVWDSWSQFCGETVEAWTVPDPDAEKVIPGIKIPSSGVEPCSLADYMGISPDVKDYTVNALPFRAYAKCCDDWFRSTPLTDPLDIPRGDADVDYKTISSGDKFSAYGGPVFTACKLHDPFTSALPSPQLGPSVGLPLGNDGFAPVSTLLNSHDPFYKSVNSYAGVPVNYNLLTSSSSVPIYEVHDDDKTIVGNGFATSNTNVVGQYRGTSSTAFSSGGHKVNTYDSAESTSLGSLLPTNLYADITDLGQITINDLRLSFAVQRFYEKAARGGSRYIELIKSMFGVTSPDARMQRSEYLGGSRCPVIIREVVNSSQSPDDTSSNPVGKLGNVAGLSNTSDISDEFIHSFTEHGTLLGCVVLRYHHVYEGLEKFWSRRKRFDMYWPAFASVGEMPLFKREIYFEPSSQNDVFGYQEAWFEYRTKPSRVCGEMRPSHDTTLASWHFGDDYQHAPTLSDSWIREDKANVDRTLAVTSSVSNQFFADIYTQVFATRVMPAYSIPGLIDHH